MKKVLILTYYWPPSGGSGVQRWLKFSRYLREFGWEPVIYTAKNAEYPVVDDSLEKEVPQGIEVIRTEIWEPYNLYKFFTGQKKNKAVVSGFLSEEKKRGLKSKISVWIRGNFFIPDARKYWIKPSIKFLKTYLKDHPVDAIVSTGPPHSMHLIGLGLKNEFHLPWIADFRDPWTKIDFYKDLHLSARADRKHHRLEKSVVEKSDKVLVIGNQMKEEFDEIKKDKTLVITNGFDEDDIPKTKPELSKEFTIVHIGMMNKDRNHPEFWKALNELKNEIPGFSSDLKIKLIGKTDFAARAEIEKNNLVENTIFIDYLKHSEAVAEQSSARVLFLSINNTPNAKGVITGKIFEYLASGRPVFCIGPLDGDAAVILRESGGGVTVNFGDKEGVKREIKNLYTQYKNGGENIASKEIEKFSRRSLTQKLAEVLNTISS